jgi:hypothetical protein
MPARIVPAGKPLVCGLVWRSLAGRQPKREIQALQRALRAVRVQRADNVAGFLVRNDLPRRTTVPRRLWSAAAMFASLPDVDPTALLILPIPEDASFRGGDREFAVIGVHQRIPLPDFDLVLSEAHLGDEVNRLSDQIHDVTNVRPTLYGDGPGAMPMTWDELAAKGSALPLEAEEARQVALAALAAVLALGLATYGWDWYQTRQRARTQQAAVVADPTPPYLASLEQQLNATTWNDGATVATFIDRAARLPADIAGFQLDRTVTCDLVQRVCAAAYLRPRGGPSTFADFRKAVPDTLFSSVAYAMDGNRVAVTLTMPDAAPRPARPSAGSFLAEGDVPLSWWPAVQQMESLSLTAILSPSPARIAGVIPPGASDTQIKGLVRVWPVTATAPAWAVAGLPTLPGLTWESVEISLAAQGGVAANLKGAIYARRS